MYKVKDIEFMAILLIVLNIYFPYFKYLYFSSYIPFFIGSLIIVVLKFKNIKFNKKFIVFFAMEVIIAVSCLTNLSANSLVYFIKFTLGLFAVVAISNTESENRQKTVKTFKYLSLFFAYSTIILLCFPNLYANINRFMFTEQTASVAIQLYEFDGFSGIAGQTGNNAFLIMIGGNIVLYEVILKKGKRKTIDIINMFIIIISILFTSKRIFLAIILLDIMIILYLYLKKNKLTKKQMKLIGIVIIIGVCFGYYAINNFKVFSRFTGNLLNGREELAGLAINVIANNPLVGVGIYNFMPYTNAESNAHNVFFQLICELGIPLGTLVIFLFYKYLYNSFKNIKCDKEINSLKIFELLGQVVFLTYFFTGNSFYDANMLYFYFVSVSLIVQKGDEIIEKNRNSNFSQSD